MNKKQAYTHESLMPFGKYKGLALGDVRPSYFVWLYDQAWIDKWVELKNWITENYEDLEEQALEGEDDNYV